jgi:hypothetical protein
MSDFWIFGSGAAVGYVLAVYTWRSLRTALVGAEQELAWLKSRALALEAKVRAALSRRDP